MIPDPVHAARQARPEHPAICYGERSLNYRELDERVARAAGVLARAGVQAGERVALRGTVDLDFVVAVHAVRRLGGILVPLSLRATPAELGVFLDGIEYRVGKLPGALPTAALHGDAAPAAPHLGTLDEVRLMVHTSGTTGAPRRVEITARQMLFSAMGSALRLGHLPADRWIACLPLHHVGGLSILYRCALYGTTVELHDRFDAEAISAAIDDGASLVSLVPVMLQRLLDARQDRPFPPTLRAILLGGARTPPALVERCRAIGVPISITWGMTETASQVATRFPGDFQPGAPPLPFAEVRADEDGALWVRGPLAPGGALCTSDLGRIDEDGRIHVTGRRDDVLISGGENIDPREVEQVLTAHPAVGDAAVVGVSDKEWGERPVAFVELQKKAGELELLDHCRASLAGFKVPSRIVILAELPRSELGKIRRGELQLLGCEDS